MKRYMRLFVPLAFALWLTQTHSAHAQWGYPGGFGMWGWDGWGASTAEGDLARGLGMFAKGEGVYNRLTAEADAINKDTLIRWNEYVYQAQQNANRARAQRRVQDRERTTALNEARLQRLRDNPELRDIHRGAALNVALDEIDDPRVYVKALQAAKGKLGADLIRHIPFKYASAAITYSIHELTNGPMPASLQKPEFAAEREAIKSLGEKIDSQIEEDQNPDPETIKQLFAAIYAAEEKVGQTFERNTRERNEAERYLKALHGLSGMLKTPAIDVILAGVDKRPDATLGELLAFMTAFNLRFGAASTPQQREVYNQLYQRLVELRNQIAPALAAATATPKVPPQGGTAILTDFFSGMSFDDLQKQAPKP
jgi:hypothetical protein